MRHPDPGAAARRHPALSPCPASQQVLKLIPDNESNLYPSVLHIPSPSPSFYKTSNSNSIPADSKSWKPRPTPTQQAALPSEQAARYECQGCLAMRSRCPNAFTSASRTARLLNARTGSLNKPMLTSVIGFHGSIASAICSIDLGREPVYSRLTFLKGSPICSYLLPRHRHP